MNSLAVANIHQEVYPRHMKEIYLFQNQIECSMELNFNQRSRYGQVLDSRIQQR